MGGKVPGNEQAKQVYLLGAGFTKSIIDDAPLNKDLLGRLVDYTKDDLFVKYQRKYSSMYKRNIEDIELLLTYLDMEIAGEDIYNPTKKESLQYVHDRLKINQAIAGFFKEYRITRNEEYAKDWVKNFCKEVLQNNDVIVNLNYDCFLEGALDSLGLWNPLEGYVGIDYHPCAKVSAPKDKNIKIFKVHGSENFVISSGYPDKTKKYISFPFDEDIFPKSARYSHLGASIDPRPYVIAPSFIKVPHIQIANIMVKAIDAARLAKTLVIIGCSMRDEDYFLRLFLSSFLNTVELKSKKIIIIDYRAEEIYKKIDSLFGFNLEKSCHVHLLSKGFQESIPDLIEVI